MTTERIRLKSVKAPYVTLSPVAAEIAHSGGIQYGVRNFSRLTEHTMTHTSKDPLHGMTLEAIVTALVARYGWNELGQRISINCFKNDPSIKSSLKFLRRTPWARKEVEDLYIASLKDSPASPPETPTDSPWANWKKKDSI